MRLEELTWTDVDDRRPVLCVPIGSCEQHGPHLPLGTDTIIAEALAARLANRRPAAVVVAPPLTITASGEHAAFAGTLSIGTDVFAATIVELVRSADWARGVILVNGHGGNRTAVERAVGELHREGRDVLAWWPQPDGGDAHAGHTETSMLLALRPDLVRRDRAVVGALDPLPALLPQLCAGGVATVSPTGVLGDPTSANAADGQRLLQSLTDDLVDRVDRWLA